MEAMGHLGLIWFAGGTVASLGKVGKFKLQITERQDQKEKERKQNKVEEPGKKNKAADFWQEVLRDLRP